MSRKKVLWVSEEAWATAAGHAMAAGVSLTDAASRLLVVGGHRVAALQKHRRTTRAARKAVAS